MIEKKELNPTISLIKIIAMLLIINSHSDFLFPTKFPFISEFNGENLSKSKK